MADAESVICRLCKARGVIRIHNDSATTDIGCFCTCEIGQLKFARVVEIIGLEQSTQFPSPKARLSDSASSSDSTISVAKRRYASAPSLASACRKGQKGLDQTVCSSWRVSYFFSRNFAEGNKSLLIEEPAALHAQCQLRVVRFMEEA